MASISIRRIRTRLAVEVRDNELTEKGKANEIPSNLKKFLNEVNSNNKISCEILLQNHTNLTVFY